MARKLVKREKSMPEEPIHGMTPPVTDTAIAGMVLQDVNIFKNRVLNCVPSVRQEEDWTIDTAQRAGVALAGLAKPPSCDLRAAWWKVRDQKNTGACVGFAAADGVLRWHYVKAGRIKQNDQTSPRFVWMANKETDDVTGYPTTFIESAGTQTKYALRIARKYGCVLEKELPMSGGLFAGSTAQFYTRAAQLRIKVFFNLGTNLDTWRYWIARQGPILTRLNCDGSWMKANTANYRLQKYPTGRKYGGHAVTLVGYTKEYFIVRNSWGTGWGRKGFVYAYDSYASKAFTEAYGAVL